VVYLRTVLRRVGILVVLALTALIAAGEAAPAFEERLVISSPSPKLRALTTITLRPYWLFARPDGTCCDYEPADVQYPFRLQLLTRGRARQLRPTRTADPYVWSAMFRFPTAGPWRVRVISGYLSASCVRIGCPYVGPELRVRVRR
jgi:hypothetical protein